MQGPCAHSASLCTGAVPAQHICKGLRIAAPQRCTACSRVCSIVASYLQHSCRPYRPFANQCAGPISQFFDIFAIYLHHGSRNCKRLLHRPFANQYLQVTVHHTFTSITPCASLCAQCDAFWGPVQRCAQHAVPRAAYLQGFAHCSPLVQHVS